MTPKAKRGGKVKAWPCPFCGASVSTSKIDGKDYVRWDFDCPNCNGGDADPILMVSVYTLDGAQAVTAWNRRAGRVKRT